MLPAVGKKAPQFSLKDTNEKTVKLSDFLGKKVVLYFYPRDMTPGCTTQACAFQSDLPKIAKKNTVVLGISTDNATAHQKFTAKYGLEFPLLSDTEHQVAEKYGVWAEKNMYGKKVWGMKRTTFIIDEEGKITKVFERVKPEGHSQEVLEALG